MDGATQTEWQLTLTSEAKQSCPVTRPLLSLPDKSTHSVPLLAYTSQSQPLISHFILYNMLHELATYKHQIGIYYYNLSLKCHTKWLKTVATTITTTTTSFLGPFYGAIAVPSVTCCRSSSLWTSHAACAIAIVGVRLATPGDWQCNGGSMGPFFKCFLFIKVS